MVRELLEKKDSLFMERGFCHSGDTMGDTWPCVDAADLETSITGETFGEWLFGLGTAIFYYLSALSNLST
jgi:hypothetical protein